jgi:hypothetical protein
MLGESVPPKCRRRVRSTAAMESLALAGITVNQTEFSLALDVTREPLVTATKPRGFISNHDGHDKISASANSGPWLRAVQICSELATDRAGLDLSAQQSQAS